MEVLPLIKETRKGLTQITLEATVDTGFEFLAKDEFKEKFGASAKVVTARGRIFFNIPTQCCIEVNMNSIQTGTLSAVSHVYVHMKSYLIK